VASKFIAGLSYQLLIINNSSCHSATELAVVPDLRGVLKPPEPMAGHAPAIEEEGVYEAYFPSLSKSCRENMTIFPSPGSESNQSESLHTK
jgi:hypothetical protein